MLLHALGESALDWKWVLSALARTNHAYTPDRPGFGGSSKPAADYSPTFFARSVSAYLDALGVEQAALAGNSLGGLVALRLALSEPERVGALALIDIAGLGREVTYALRLPTLPGYGEGAVAWGKTPLGALGRAWWRVPLLFGRPERVPAEWITEQTKIAQLPDFTEATMAALRAQVDMGGQREVLIDQRPHLQMPALIVWGEQDRVSHVSQAREVVTRLQEGSLDLISDYGHLPQIERPERFVTSLSRFLSERAERRRHIR